MKARHIFHIALFTVALFGGYQMGTAFYARFFSRTTSAGGA